MKPRDDERALIGGSAPSQILKGYAAGPVQLGRCDDQNCLGDLVREEFSNHVIYHHMTESYLSLNLILRIVDIFALLAAQR